ncbi:MAG: protein kinase domain-containing protein, partial [Phycisphaerae bacterium]
GGGRHRPPSIPSVAPPLRRSVAMPKILDFGVARVVGSEMTLATMQTVTGQVIGTLPYMSPEQVAGRAMDVDTRSDVYSLGVSLYELLAERLPYEVTNCTLPEAARIISDVEPTHLSVVDRRFRGDVETIVTKALQKDRAQRYASVAELAADIRRYLADEPVQARPPSAMYQLRKFARRNKALVGGTIGIFAALVLGLAGVLWFAAGESRQRATAENASSEARRLAYRVSVGAAADALAENNTITARRLLSDAPQELRGWEWRHLETALDNSKERVRFEQVRGGLVRPRADGTVLFGELARVHHVDLRAVRIIATYASERAAAIAIDPDLNLIARIVDASQVMVHDLESGAATTIPAPGGLSADNVIGALEFSNDSSLLAVSHNDGTLVLHDLRTQQPRWTARLSVPKVLDLSFAPHDGLLAAGGLAGLEIFSVESGALVLKRFRPSLARFVYTQWSPDGSIFYRREWTEDHKQHFFTPIRVESGEELPHWPSHPRELISVQASRDFSTALAVTAEGMIRLVEPATGRVQLEPGERATGHTAVFSPDEQQILFTQLSGTIGILDRRSGARLGTLRGPETSGSLAFSTDGRQLLSLTGDGTLRTWDYSASGEPDVLRGHDSFVYPVTFSPDGRTLASGGWDKAIRLWDVQTRRELRVLRGHTAPVYSVAFSADGRWVLSHASAAESEHLLWDVETGTSRTLPPLDGESHEPPCFVDATPRIWLPGSVGPTQRVWNAETDQIELIAWDEVAPRLESLGSPDGQWLVRLRIDPTTRTPSPTLLSTRDHTVTRALPEPAVRAVLNHDGSRLATIETPTSDTVIIWDVATGAKLRTLTGHIGEVFDVRFSPDGERIASAGRDGSIRIWDATRFELLVRLRGHTDYVWGLNWSPDGTMLVSGSGDTTIRLWPTSTATAITPLGESAETPAGPRRRGDE